MHRLLFSGWFFCHAFLSAADWPAWRGPAGNGVCEEKNLPTRWSATDHVKWKVDLPEPGNSTPIVVAGKVFLTQAVGDQRLLMCFDRQDGRLLWQKGVTSSEEESTHKTNPYCSSSPVSDGERVIVSFASDGLFCYDLEGTERWRRTDLGRQVHIWGAGTSPVIQGDLCLLNFGPGATTYLLAVNKRTGETLWRHDEDTGYNRPRREGGNPTFIGSWSTPVVARLDGRDQVLMSWPRRLAAYDPASGKELWTCAGLNALVYTSPLVSPDGIVVAMGGYGGQSLAIRPTGTGDLTPQRLWHLPKTKQRIGSGVIHEGHLYIHNDPGTAECYDLKTGRVVWEERLQGTVATGQNWSSVMLADGLCYTLTQGGDGFVFKASPQFELVAVNPLGERSNSSVVPSDGELFIRTHQALRCIRQSPVETEAIQ